MRAELASGPLIRLRVDSDGTACGHAVRMRVGFMASLIPPTPRSDRYLTRQTGPRRLWDQAAAAYRWWQQHGEPGIEDWRWTIQPHRQRISLT